MSNNAIHLNGTPTEHASLAQLRIESNKGTYKDLAILAAEKFMRLQELLMAIEGASNTGDKAKIIEGVCITGKTIACDMAGLFDYVANQATELPKQDELKADESNINMSEVAAILCELLSATTFVNNTSRLLKQEHLFGEDKLVSTNYRSDLLDGISKVTVKQLELHTWIDEELGFNLSFPEHKVKLGLFDIPPIGQKLTTYNKN